MSFFSTRPRFSFLISATFFVLCALLYTGPARCAGGPGFKVIRDVEIEQALKTYGEPIWQAAGINPESVHIILINDPTLNAFVAGGQNIFFHTGLLQAAETPEQIIGIIAHETGHISGGHLVRGNSALKEASAEAILSMVLGTAAAVLSGDPGAGAAVITGGQSIAQRSILSFSRAQESSADAAGMRFLDGAKISSRGLMEFLEKLSGQELLPVDRQVEYLRTHPLTQDRIDAVHYHVEQSPYSGNKASKEFYDLHERMRAKLLGYLKPDSALLRFAEKDGRLSARYARAIAYYRKGDIDKANKGMDVLLREEPNNPYFYELKGQILFENARVDEAVKAYAKAVELKPDAGLIEASYGHALLEIQNSRHLDEAIEHLNNSLKTEPRESSTWRFLATAWGRKNDEGMVSYCLAEEAISKGDIGSAHKWADRALKLLPKSSSYVIRAQDIKQTRNEDEE
jgi:predicted Zn-dependent protease